MTLNEQYSTGISKDNILLIGMPGCGKSTIGRLLADRMSFDFLDADEVFEKKTGISPACFIEKSGEQEFRKRESEILGGFSLLTHTVISLGGGVVEIPANKDLIREAGTVVYIRRDNSDLALDNRPLSLSKGIEKLYELRHEKYENWSDISIDNIGDINDVSEDLYSIIASRVRLFKGNTE